MKSFFQSLNRSTTVFAILLALLFLCMLVLNHWTPYLVDDFCYMLSFDTREPLQGLSDIPASMYAHCFTMNGRVIAHALEQVFLLMPKLVFNLCNAAVFVWLIYACFVIICGERKPNAWLLLAFGMGLWCFLPVFGQVCLWQVGSLNYLWALAAGVFFLRPFLAGFSMREDALYRCRALWKRIGFTLLAFLVGTYSEVTSFVVLFLAGCLTVLSCIERKTAKTWLWFPLAAAGAGYLFLLNLPAEKLNKAGSFALESLVNNLPKVLKLFRRHLLTLCILWAVLMGLAILLKTERRRQLISLLFALGAAGGTLMLIAASYRPERCLCTTALFLLIACGILFADLLKTRVDLACNAAVCALCVVFLLSFEAGVKDIRKTQQLFYEREAYILSQKSQGVTEVVCERIYPETEYSAAYGLQDLNKEDPNSWPNCYMARYYGVSTIIMAQK